MAQYFHRLTILVFIFLSTNQEVFMDDAIPEGTVKIVSSWIKFTHKLVIVTFFSWGCGSGLIPINADNLD